MVLSNFSWAIVTAGALAAASLPSAAQAQSSCVTTAAQYAAAFNSCQPVSCVAPSLYGVIGGGTPADQTSVYPSTFYWGWVGGAESLQQYADWQVQACQGTLAESEVTHRILLWVGFGEGDITKGAPYTLSVMDLGSEPSLFVPAWEQWFLAFERAFGIVVPLDAQKNLTLNLGNAVTRDPTRQFAEITGCSAHSAAHCTDQPLSACSADYQNAANALISQSPIEGTGSTTDCANAFKTYIGTLGRSTNAAEVRAMLRYCQDVNPCNSGQGLGFNPAYPPGGGTLTQHFTGREYVLLNKSLQDLGAAFIALQPVQ
jgi:hypothetical protein